MRRPLAVPRLVCCVLLCVAGCRTRDAERASGARPAVGAASDRPAVLATVPEEEKTPASTAPSVLGLHPTPHGPTVEFVFADRGGGVAFAVEQGEKVHVVHNGRAGKPYAAVGEIALSPDGSRCAYGALADGRWRMVVDGTEGASFDTVKAPVFSPDGAHVAYQAMAGELWHLVVDRTVNGGTRTRYQRHAFSGDSSKIAFVDDVDDVGKGRLVVSDLDFKKQTFVAGNVASFTLDAGASRLAAVVTSGDRSGVVTLAFARPEAARKGPPYDAVYGLAFGPDGSSLAYVAERSGKRFVVLNDVEEPAGGGDMILSPVVAPGGGVGAFVVGDGAVRLRHFFGERAPEEAGYEEADGLVYSSDGRSHAYAARNGDSWFIVVNGKAGPLFDRVVTPRFSPDGRLVAYRARKDGKRFVVTADTNARTIRQHPSYEQVFPVLFTADGRSVAYGAKDDRQLVWKVEAP